MSGTSASVSFRALYGVKMFSKFIMCLSCSCALEAFQETALRVHRPSEMVELERQLQRRPEKPLMIFAPDDEWIVENAAVHADSAVDFGIHDGGGADDHAARQVVIFTAFR